MKIDLVLMADVAGYAESRRRLFNLDPRLASTAPLVAGPKGEKPESADEDVQEKGEHGDVRTLWVDYDEHGERLKRWRDVCAESFTPAFDTKPIEGP